MAMLRRPSRSAAALLIVRVEGTAKHAIMR